MQRGLQTARQKEIPMVKLMLKVTDSDWQKETLKGKQKD